MTSGDDGGISGSMTMQLIGMGDGPFAEEQGYGVDVPEAAGKEDPFSPIRGAKGGAAAASPSRSPDFYMILNTYDDNASKVILGKYPQAQTEVYYNANQAVKGTLTVTKSSGGYSYSYNVGSDKYSGRIEGESGSLAMTVISRPRSSGGDKVSVTLDITNNSGVPLNISVTNDDAAKPRFILGKTSGTVKCQMTLFQLQFLEKEGYLKNALFKKPQRVHAA
jgi:type IV pilus assembly protein PilO